MRANTTTKLPLWRWATIMGLNPLHAAGVQLPNLDVGSSCESGILQYDWQQSDRVSREQIARYIAEAEQELEAVLGYHLLPAWTTDERVAAPDPYHSGFRYGGAADALGYNRTVPLFWRHFISGGVRNSEVIEEAATITWDAAGAANWKAWGEVTVETLVDDACEIRAYYPGYAGDPAWEIRPISVTLGDGEAVIRFRRELTVKDSVLEELTYDSRLVDGTTDANFLSTVDIYRVWNDPSTQVSFLWEPPRGVCACVTRHDVFTTQTGFLIARNERLSHVGYSPGTWDADDAQYNVALWTGCLGEPDVLRAWYLSGYQDRSKTCPRLEMDDRLARIVAEFATSKIERPLCSCQEDKFAQLRADLAFVSGSGETARYQVDFKELSNPLGSRRGALQAWREITRTGMAVGQHGVRTF